MHGGFGVLDERARVAAVRRMHRNADAHRHVNDVAVDVERAGRQAKQALDLLLGLLTSVGG